MATNTPEDCSQMNLEGEGDSAGSQNSSHLVVEPDIASMCNTSSTDVDLDSTTMNENELVIDEETPPGASDEANLYGAYDQYTDTFSQESYQQEPSSDNLMKEEEEEFSIDDTLNHHINALTDKYFDDSVLESPSQPVPSTSSGIQRRTDNNRSVLEDRDEYGRDRYTSNKAASKSFRPASDLLTCQKSAAELLKSQKEAADNEKKLFRSAAELLKSRKEAVDSAKKKRESTTDEEVEDKVNKNAISPVAARLTRARGKRGGDGGGKKKK
eukprot:TRINITY_DN10331_c0_g1_i6.p1 TRINITY_DN10331_c0_g1~~TRINITY_DN10331_c0_g1_i6.p1  ORF type:complete len:300 (+),score=91.72 TRINITY_DN10331_c0_g1_i6:92-901(+)